MRFLTWVLLYGYGSAALSFAAEHREANRPNVLFIAVDDLRAELGCYGTSQVKSPHIDGLAKSGTFFRRAYCQQALCNPSRASLLTGLRPDSLRVWDLPTHFREHYPDIVTLPQCFKQHGYFAQDVGKIFHNFRQDKHRGDAPSWSIPAVLHYGSHYNDHPHLRGDLPANDATLEKTECRDVPDEAYYDGRVAAAAVEALQQMEQQPFFLAVGFWKPHLPFNAPKKYWDLYERDDIQLPRNHTLPDGAPPYAGFKYRVDDKRLTNDDVRELRHGHLAAISYLDAQVGKVLDELDRQGLRDNTIVVFWSDHGLHVGERQLWGKNTNYELDARVPLIIATPWHPAGQVSESLVELVDIYPTLIEICKLNASHQLEGVSLVPILMDPRASVKDFAITQNPRKARDVGHDATDGLMGYSLRTDTHRYTEWCNIRTGAVCARELYDHRSDQEETLNIAESQTVEIQRLSKLLRSFQREASQHSLHQEP
ncbi:MAG: sulfatase [Pirellulaceae bacterium]|nr:sulfatase [Pirellulaceae bacterium]